MRNLKKILATALVFAMVLSLGMSASAFDPKTTAFKDGGDLSPRYYGAVDILTELGVVQGKPGAELAPKGVYTRAEMAYLTALILAGGERNVLEPYNSADFIKENGITRFNDVYIGDWYAGALYYLKSLGVVHGDGNDAFKPNDPADRIEVAAYALGVIGYDKEANGYLGSTWKLAVQRDAAYVGLYANIPASTDTQITREEIFQMFENALASDSVYWNAGANQFMVNAANGQNISVLENRFKQYTRVRGVLVANPFASVSKDVNREKDRVYIADTANIYAGVQQAGSFNYNTPRTYIIDNVTDAAEKAPVKMLGRYVYAFAKKGVYDERFDSILGTVVAVDERNKAPLDPTGSYPTNYYAFDPTANNTFSGAFNPSLYTGVAVHNFNWSADTMGTAKPYSFSQGWNANTFGNGESGDGTNTNTEIYATRQLSRTVDSYRIRLTWTLAIVTSAGDNITAQAFDGGLLKTVDGNPKIVINNQAASTIEHGDTLDVDDVIMVLLDNKDGFDGARSWDSIPRAITVRKCEKIDGVLDRVGTPTRPGGSTGFTARIDGKTYNLNENKVWNAAYDDANNSYGLGLYNRVAQSKNFGNSAVYYSWTDDAGDEVLVATAGPAGAPYTRAMVLDGNDGMLGRSALVRLLTEDGKQNNYYISTLHQIRSTVSNPTGNDPKYTDTSGNDVLFWKRATPSDMKLKGTVVPFKQIQGTTDYDKIVMYYCRITAAGDGQDYGTVELWESDIARGRATGTNSTTYVFDPANGTGANQKYVEYQKGNNFLLYNGVDRKTLYRRNDNDHYGVDNDNNSLLFAYDGSQYYAFKGFAAASSQKIAANQSCYALDNSGNVRYGFLTYNTMLRFGNYGLITSSRVTYYEDSTNMYYTFSMCDLASSTFATKTYTIVAGKQENDKGISATDRSQIQRGTLVNYYLNEEGVIDRLDIVPYDDLGLAGNNPSSAPGVDPRSAFTAAGMGWYRMPIAIVEGSGGSGDYFLVTGITAGGGGTQGALGADATLGFGIDPATGIAPKGGKLNLVGPIVDYGKPYGDPVLAKGYGDSGGNGYTGDTAKYIELANWTAARNWVVANNNQYSLVSGIRADLGPRTGTTSNRAGALDAYVLASYDDLSGETTASMIIILTDTNDTHIDNSKYPKLYGADDRRSYTPWEGIGAAGKTSATPYDGFNPAPQGAALGGNYTGSQLTVPTTGNVIGVNVGGVVTDYMVSGDTADFLRQLMAAGGNTASITFSNGAIVQVTANSLNVGAGILDFDLVPSAFGIIQKVILNGNAAGTTGVLTYTVGKIGVVNVEGEGTVNGEYKDNWGEGGVTPPDPDDDIIEDLADTVQDFVDTLGTLPGTNPQKAVLFGEEMEEWAAVPENEEWLLYLIDTTAPNMTIFGDFVGEMAIAIAAGHPKADLDAIITAFLASKTSPMVTSFAPMAAAAGLEIVIDLQVAAGPPITVTLTITVGGVTKYHKVFPEDTTTPVTYSVTVEPATATGVTVKVAGNAATRVGTTNEYTYESTTGTLTGVVEATAAGLIGVSTPIVGDTTAYTLTLTDPGTGPDPVGYAFTITRNPGTGDPKYTTADIMIPAADWEKDAEYTVTFDIVDIDDDGVSGGTITADDLFMQLYAETGAAPWWKQLASGNVTATGNTVSVVLSEAALGFDFAALTKLGFQITIKGTSDAKFATGDTVVVYIDHDLDIKPAIPGPDPDVPMASITGVVKNTAGATITSATVALSGVTGITNTGTNGAFIFTLPEASITSLTLTLNASAAGYDNNSLVVPAIYKNLEIVLTASPTPTTATVTGLVVDAADGTTPIVGATATLTGAGVTTDSKITDGSGHFTFVVPATATNMTVEVSKDGYVTDSKTGVATGASLKFELVTTGGPTPTTATVTGLVVDAADGTTPIVGATATLTGAGVTTDSKITDGSGHFTFVVPATATNMTVAVSADGYVTDSKTGVATGASLKFELVTTGGPTPTMASITGVVTDNDPAGSGAAPLAATVTLTGANGVNETTTTSIADGGVFSFDLDAASITGLTLTVTSTGYVSQTITNADDTAPYTFELVSLTDLTTDADMTAGQTLVEGTNTVNWSYGIEATGELKLSAATASINPVNITYGDGTSGTDNIQDAMDGGGVTFTSGTPDKANQGYAILALPMVEILKGMGFSGAIEMLQINDALKIYDTPHVNIDITTTPARKSGSYSLANPVGTGLIDTSDDMFLIWIKVGAADSTVTFEIEEPLTGIKGTFIVDYSSIS